MRYILIAALLSCGFICSEENNGNENLPSIEGYQQWYSIVQTGPVPGHGDTYRVIYLNDSARDYDNGTYDTGSVFVKEIYHHTDDGKSKGDLKYVALMRRVDALDIGRDDPIEGGWLFTMQNGTKTDGSDTHNTICYESCHKSAPYDGAWLDYTTIDNTEVPTEVSDEITPTDTTASTTDIPSSNDDDTLPSIAGYTSWESVVATGPVPGHGDGYRIIYFNDKAADFDGTKYQTGSVFVKEIYNFASDGASQGSLKYVALMRQLDGLNIEGNPVTQGGWFFTHKDDTDSNTEDTYAGAFCYDSCHVDAPYDGAFLEY